MATRRGYRSGQRNRSHPVRWLVLLCVLAVVGWFGSLYLRIERVADHDEAQPADAIAVFGAAQYRGHPSPVYHARLDHAVSLYGKGMAPIIVTLGGSGDDASGHSEGAVGRDYLLAQGVPFDRIIAETKSVDTEQQAELLAEIAREHGFARMIVVSDGTHLFRVRELCREQGLEVFTSPRSAFGNLSPSGQAARVSHEMLSYTFYASARGSSVGAAVDGRPGRVGRA